MNLLSIFRRLLHYFHIDTKVDEHDNIHSIIESDVVFKVTNLWILIFAIIVASVGLNMNFTAVIIGAMLISPLMGPINGVGYSIATYNFPLFYRAVKNYTFAVIAGLIASTLYFAITPISTAHSELLARISPTIYDVLIAFFGGLAGIVAISSKKKGNVIPGVAIATALMPPLCTAGYGLATGQFNFFFGALYLFTINSVFISLASLMVSQVLKFPIRAQISDAKKRKINRIISGVGILIIIPSVYFGYILVQDVRFQTNADLFIKSVSTYNGKFLLKHEIITEKRTIYHAYGGSSLTDEEKKSIENHTKDFKLENTKIIFQQGLSFDGINKEYSELMNLKFELNDMNILLEKKNSELDKIRTKKLFGRQLLEEASALFPQIESVFYSDSYVFTTLKDEPDSLDVVVFSLNTQKLEQSEYD